MRVSRNPIFNGTVGSIDKPSTGNRVAWYTSMNRLVNSYVEKGVDSQYYEEIAVFECMVWSDWFPARL